MRKLRNPPSLVCWSQLSISFVSLSRLTFHLCLSILPHLCSPFVFSRHNSFRPTSLYSLTPAATSFLILLSRSSHCFFVMRQWVGCYPTLSCTTLSAIPQALPIHFTQDGSNKES